MKKSRGHNNRAIKINNVWMPFIEWNMWYYHRWTQHRIGKPAVIWREGGTCEWWIRGKRYYDTALYCKTAKMRNINTMKMMLKYGHTLPTNIDQL